MVGYTQLFFSKKDQGARTPSGLVKQLQEMFLPPGVRLPGSTCPGHVECAYIETGLSFTMMAALPGASIDPMEYQL